MIDVRRLAQRAAEMEFERDEARDSLATLRIVHQRLKRDALARIQALHGLLVAYRLGKNPTEAVWARLEKTKSTEEYLRTELEENP